MNDAPIKLPEGFTNETPGAELSQPHFDEIAVLIAQPVQPIAARERDWFAWLAKPRMMIAIFAVAALLATTALALTLQLPRSQRADAAAPENKADETQIDKTKTAEPQAVAETPLGAIPNQLKRTAPRRRIRRAVSSDEAKPVARRVGVIHGNSSDRP